MANGEDRPIVLIGGDAMYTITLPQDTSPEGGQFTVKSQPQFGPYKKIEVANTDTKEVLYTSPASGNWTITIT